MHQIGKIGVRNHMKFLFSEQFQEKKSEFAQVNQNSSSNSEGSSSYAKPWFLAGWAGTGSMYCSLTEC